MQSLITVIKDASMICLMLLISLPTVSILSHMGSANLDRPTLILPSLTFFWCSAKHTIPPRATTFPQNTVNYTGDYMTFFDANFEILGVVLHNSFPIVFQVWKAVFSSYFAAVVLIFSDLLVIYQMTKLPFTSLQWLSCWSIFYYSKSP